LARETQKCPAKAPTDTPVTSPPAGLDDADLARVVTAWPNLPPAIRRGILAMVEAAVTGK
jgi:hypothetical protein